jgi:uncharacterized protein (DUF697 family)
MGASTPSRSASPRRPVSRLPGADDLADAAADTPLEDRLVPVVWLLGKVQSGKTSIIRAVTRSTDAEIGSGFRPATRTARLYDYRADAPMLRFLDTRGLAEAGYDPSDDLALFETRAHLVLVTMRAMDLAQQDVVAALRTVRRRHPEWPVVVAQTCLHEGYERGAGHLLPYPFDPDVPEAAGTVPLPVDLRRCLARQRDLVRAVPGAAPILFVPVDLTVAGDGLDPLDYGLDALTDALVRAAPAAMRAVLETLPSASLDGRRQRAEPLIMGHAMAAAGSDLVPAAGAVAVSAVQARLLHRLGRLYDVPWDRRTMAEFSGALGTGILTRTAVGFGLRQLAKFVPVYGQTIAAASSAAASFAVTFALGRAAVFFLTRRRRGQSSAGTAAAYESALREAVALARTRLGRGGGGDAPTGPAR